MDVMCRKYSCIYNDRAKCIRKNLNISEHADCGDLIMNNDKIVEDVSLDMFEHEPDLAPFHHCKTMFIRCSCLVCIYNKSGECYSNGIFVGSEIDDAPCNSYVPK